MASLTSNIPGEDSGKRIIQPAQQSSGFLDGLAKAGGEALNAFSSNTALTDKLSGEKALNETERGVTNLRIQAEQAIRAPVSDRPVTDFMNIGNMAEGDAAPLPTDLALQKQAIDKTSRGITQGRTAVSQLDVQLEQFQQTIETKYPDQAAKIGSYMHSQGYDHYMWRGSSDAIAADESDKAAVNSGRAMVIDYAQKAGVNQNGTMTPDELFQTGSQLLDSKTKAEQFKLLQEQNLAAKAAQRADSAESRAQSDFAQKQADRAGSDFAQSVIASTLSPIYSSLKGLIETGGDSEDFAARFEKLNGSSVMFANNFKNHLRSTLAQQGAGQDVIDKAMAGVDDQVKGFNDLVAGSTSQVAQKKRTLDLMQTNWGLKLDQSLKLAKYAKEVLGPSWADGTHGIDVTKVFSPEMSNRIAGELQNFDPTKPNTGWSLMHEIGALVNGDMSLNDKPPGYWNADHMQGITSMADTAGKRVMTPAIATPADTKNFLNAQSNVVIAANSFTNANKDYNAANYAISAITKSSSVVALDSLIRNPDTKTQAVNLLLASRSAAATILESARGTVPKVEDQSLVIENGRWVVKVAPSPGKFKTGGLGAGAPGGGVMFGGQAPFSNVKDPTLVKVADTMNKSVNFLVDTAQVDPKHAGVDPTVLRSHFMSGTPLPQKEGEKAQAVDWNANASALEAELNNRGKELDKSMPLNVFNPDKAKYAPMVGAAAEQYGVPQGVAEWVMQHENGWKNVQGTTITGKDGKPASSAFGMGQFIDETGAKYGLIKDGVDHRGDPEQAIPAMMHYLSDLAKKNGGDWKKAVDAYGTTKRSNFKSDKDHQDVLASLNNVLGGQ